MWKFAAVLLLAAAAVADKPHIIFLLVDDMGFNDIGYNNDWIPTPYMNKLASDGVILSNNYMHPVCTASRAALMAGVYAFKTGLQLIMDNRPMCLPLDFTTLAERMHDAGYQTSMVGKWHLGFCDFACSPYHRGFETFYGLYNGYFDHWTKREHGAFDLRNGDEVVTNPDEIAQFSTFLWEDKAIDVFNNRDKSRPLFMYLASDAPHFPAQAPDEYIERCEPPPCSDEHCDHRRIFCGMVAALDDSVRGIIDGLRKAGMYDNSILIFTSDNGGPTHHSSNNWPLRGSKQTIWEGGVKAVSWIHSPLLTKTGYVHDGFMHVVDWTATVLALGGAEPDPNGDGFDQTDMILHGGPSKRTSFVYNLDMTRVPFTFGKAGVRDGDWKLLVGPAGLPMNHSWYIPAERSDEGLTVPVVDMKNMPVYHLFNIKDDPLELNNLADANPEKVAELEAVIEDWKTKAREPIFPKPDPASDPSKHGMVWTPGWCDASQL